jgi:hypothetical protein
MATSTITKARTAARGEPQSAPPSRRLPGWLWFALLWCAGVGSAMAVGFAFKVLMNATLFAVAR